MSPVLTVSVQTMATFIVFFIVGALLSAKKLVPENTGTAVSRLVTMIFMPAMCFNSFAGVCTPEKLRDYAVILIASIALIPIMLTVGFILRRHFPGKRIEKLAVFYTMVISNFGFVGYPLILAIYGQEMQSNFMMFCLPFNMVLYSYIYPQYMPEDMRGGTLKKLLNPSLVAIFLGIGYGLIGIPYTPFMQSIFTTASACSAPCAMLVAGMTVGKLSLRKAFSDPRAYVLTGMREVAAPVVIGALAFIVCRTFFPDKDLFRIILLFSAMPVGLNPVVFAESFGEDSTFAARSAMVGTLFSVLSIPAFVAIAEVLCKML